MKPISLNDLPLWSPWPGRLLGSQSWSRPERTIDKIEQEYTRDKYGACLDFYEKHLDSTVERIKTFEFGDNNERSVCVSIQNELFEQTLGAGRERHLGRIIEELTPSLANAASIVELGAGYGYNVWRLWQGKPNSRFVAAEYAQTAVQLGAMLYAKIPSIQVEKFNYYDGDTYRFFETLQPPIVVFTVHSIEQLPSCRPFLKALSHYSEKVAKVIHFEPAYELHDETLLGLLRRRYVEANDYNRDLVSALREHPGIHIDRVEANYYGLNPLNATSLIEWHYEPV